MRGNSVLLRWPPEIEFTSVVMGGQRSSTELPRMDNRVLKGCHCSHNLLVFIECLSYQFLHLLP